MRNRDAGGPALWLAVTALTLAVVFWLLPLHAVGTSPLARFFGDRTQRAAPGTSPPPSTPDSPAPWATDHGQDEVSGRATTTARPDADPRTTAAHAGTEEGDGLPPVVEAPSREQIEAGEAPDKDPAESSAYRDFSNEPPAEGDPGGFEVEEQEPDEGHWSDGHRDQVDGTPSFGEPRFRFGVFDRPAQNTYTGTEGWDAESRLVGYVHHGDWHTASCRTEGQLIKNGGGYESTTWVLIDLGGQAGYLPNTWFARDDLGPLPPC